MLTPTDKRIVNYKMIERISVLITIPVLLVGGTEMQTLSLVKVLIETGYRVTVCCYYESDLEMVALQEEAGADVILMRLERSKGLWYLFRELVSKFKESPWNIVHVQYVAPGLVPIIAARVAGITNVLATVHQPGRTYGSKAKFMLRFGARLCKAFLCVSKSAETSWFGDSAFFDPKLYKNGRRHFTIYNSVESDSIAAKVKSQQVAQFRNLFELEGKTVVGYVGRLRSEKGVEILLEAASLACLETSGSVLLVVGDGPDRNNLEVLAKQLGLDQQIIWLGSKSRDEVFTLYGVMDILVVPSHFEGFGLVAAEAMAAGLPVVASNVDGLGEVIEDGETGLLFESGNSKELADKLLHLLNDYDERQRMGMAGKVSVKNNFSIEGYRQDVDVLYTTVLNT